MRLRRAELLLFAPEALGGRLCKDDSRLSIKFERQRPSRISCEQERENNFKVFIAESIARFNFVALNFSQRELVKLLENQGLIKQQQNMKTRSVPLFLLLVTDF